MSLVSAGEPGPFMVLGTTIDGAPLLLVFEASVTAAAAAL